MPFPFSEGTDCLDKSTNRCDCTGTTKQYRPLMQRYLGEAIMVALQIWLSIFPFPRCRKIIFKKPLQRYILTVIQNQRAYLPYR